MALDLGTLVAKLKVDDSEYKKGLKDAPRTAEEAGKQIGDKVESGARPGLGRLTKLLASLGLGALAVGAAKYGVETYAANEKAAISFTTMLGSAEKAQSFLDKMKDFAATTPFEFPELQTAASSLISAGVNADKVLPIMRTLGDVTSGMGTGSEGIKRATVALQQMQAAGKITGEDLNQLRDAGIPVYDLLAAATGKSKDQIVALAQAGKLGKKELDAMMTALESGKGLEKFNGLMDAQSKSLEGTISNLKDTLGQNLADAVAPIMPFIKEGIGKLTESLPGVVSNLKGFSEWLVATGKGAQEAYGWLAKHEGVIKPLAVTVGVLVLGYQALALAQGIAAAGGFLSFVGQVTGLTRAWAVVQGILNVVMAANPIALVVIAIAALVAGFIVAYNTSEDFRNVVNGAFDAVADAGRWLWNNALAPAFRFIVSGFAGVMRALADFVGALGNIPGFEWAKDAAGKLRGMADQAEAAARGIKNIPDRKDVEINLQINGAAKLDAVGRNFRALQIQGALASGGPVSRTGAYLVGEEGPEIVKLAAGQEVVPAGRTRSILSGSGNGSQPAIAATADSGFTRLHPDDLRALAGMLYAATSASVSSAARATHFAGRPA